MFNLKKEYNHVINKILFLFLLSILIITMNCSHNSIENIHELKQTSIKAFHATDEKLMTLQYHDTGFEHAVNSVLAEYGPEGTLKKGINFYPTQCLQGRIIIDDNFIYIKFLDQQNLKVIKFDYKNPSSKWIKEYENEILSGFKIISYKDNLYYVSSSSIKKIGTDGDPESDISINNKSTNKSLSMNGFNMYNDYIYCGYSVYDYDIKKYQIGLMKINLKGEIKSAKIFTNDHESGYHYKVLFCDNSVIFTYKQSSLTTPINYVMKLDLDCNFIKELKGFDIEDYFNILTDEKNIYVSGQSYDQKKTIVSKYGSNGILVWSKKIKNGIYAYEKKNDRIFLDNFVSMSINSDNVYVFCRIVKDPKSARPNYKQLFKFKK